MRQYKALFFAAITLLLVLLSGCDNNSTPATPTFTLVPTPAAPTVEATAIPSTPTLVVTSIPLVIVTATPTSDVSVSPERIAQARNVIEQLAAGDFAGVVANFDTTMSTQLSADKLQQAWGQIITQYGAYKSVVDTQTSKQQGHDVVVLTSDFDKGRLDASVVFDTDGHIAGLFFKPSASSPSPTPGLNSDSTLPTYVDKSKFTERDVTVGSGEWALPGTLSMPAGNGPFPAVVLIQGSGPQDRDETIGSNKPFQDLAWGLASNGIAVLRYDKRTHVYASKIAAIQDKITIKEEVVDDAVSAVSLLGTTQGVDPGKVFVLGHSLGGSLDPLIAQSAPSVAGLVIMAGSTRPFEDLILEQYTYIFGLDGTVTADEQKQLDDLKTQIMHVKDPNLSLSTPASELPLGIAPAYWLSLRAYSAGRVASSLKVPMLILQGESDYQVTMQDFQGWKDVLSSHTNVEFKSYPRLFHPFIETQSEGKATPADYNKPGHVAAQVVSDIAAWLKGH